MKGIRHCWGILWDTAHTPSGFADLGSGFHNFLRVKETPWHTPFALTACRLERTKVSLAMAERQSACYCGVHEAPLKCVNGQKAGHQNE